MGPVVVVADAAGQIWARYSVIRRTGILVGAAGAVDVDCSGWFVAVLAAEVQVEAEAARSQAERIAVIAALVGSRMCYIDSGRMRSELVVVKLVLYQKHQVRSLFVWEVVTLGRDCVPSY